MRTGEELAIFAVGRFVLSMDAKREEAPVSSLIIIHRLHISRLSRVSPYRLPFSLFPHAMPRVAKSSSALRHDPLHVQLREDEVHAKYGRLSQPGKRKKSRKSADNEDSGDVSP